MSASLLKQRFTIQERRLRSSLQSDLQHLQIRVKQALSALEDDEALDEHLIINAGSLTTDIAKWNMLVDNMPCLVDVT